MEIKRPVVLRTIAGESMLIPIGDTVLDFNGIFQLSETGKQLWELIENGAEKVELVEYLQKEYGVDCKTANEDVTEFLNMLTNYGII